MAFSAADVKNLREMTGVGMMDCKKALTAADGDIDKAVEWLREKGLAAAQKKAGRIAAEGMGYAAVIDGVGVVVEVNAESDFVAPPRPLSPHGRPHRRARQPRDRIHRRCRRRAGQGHRHADRGSEPDLQG